MAPLFSWCSLAAGAMFMLGLVLLWQGWRGGAELSELFCRVCGRDLRGLNWCVSPWVCPGCAVDLSGVKAVRFGERRMRPWRVVTGGAVLVFGLMIPPGARMVFMHLQRRAAAPMTNQSLIADLAQRGDSSLPWSELARRYRTGQLNAQEATAAIDQLIAWLSARSSIRGTRLAWSGQFVAMVLKHGAVSNEQLGRLADAYYGPSLQARMRSRVRRGKKLQFRIEAAVTEDLPGTQLIFVLRDVSVDGRAVELEGPFREVGRARGHGIWGVFKTPLEPGTHEVQFRLDRGLADERAKVDPIMNPRIPGHAELWSKALLKQEITSIVRVEVVPPGVEMVRLVTDPKLDPAQDLSINRIDVFPAGGGRVRMRPRFERKRLSVPVMFRLFVDIGDEEVMLGTCGGTGAANLTTCNFVRGPSPSTSTVRVVLQPDAAAAEDQLETDQIWGKPILFENVPLERYDLEEEGPSETRPSGTASGPAAETT
jgi:hypothetical protein